MLMATSITTNSDFRATMPIRFIIFLFIYQKKEVVLVDNLYALISSRRLLILVGLEILWLCALDVVDHLAQTIGKLAEILLI